MNLNKEIIINYKFYSIFLKLNLIIILFIYLMIYNHFYHKKRNIKITNIENIKFTKKFNNNKYRINKKISIYKYLKIPKISIVLRNENYKDEKKKFLKFLNILKANCCYDDNFEVILLISEKLSLKYNDIISNYSNNKDKIKIIITKENYILKLVNIINGKFVLFLDNFLFLEKDLLELFYNNTFGKIDNIFESNIKNIDKKYYLIKTKILRDIIDNGIKFKKINDLIIYVLNLHIPNINYISISFCLDNIYILNAYVAMISILDNKNYFTYISFYLIVAEDFKKENIDLISSLYEQYDLFNITFIKTNLFKNVITFRYITKSAYYKLMIADLLPELNKIIYLDSDIIVYKDLFNLYNHNFKNKLILAAPIFGAYNFNNITKTYNTGILLMNLQKMREINFTKKIKEILNNGFTDTKYHLHDQAILNQFFYEYIGDLELDYNSRINLFKYNSKYYITNKEYYNYFNLINSENHPFIYHFTGPNKPITHKIKNSGDWWYYARKGKYYQKILENST